MECLNCKNTKDFIVFGNQNIKIHFGNNYLKEVKKEDFNISDIYPVICAKCQSEEVDFNYSEIKGLIDK